MKPWHICCTALVDVMVAAYIRVVMRMHTDAAQEPSRQLLRELEHRTELLLAYLMAHSPGDPRTQAMRARWLQGGSGLRATSRPDPSDVAHIIDKTHVYICTHQALGGPINDPNASFHVLLHELAHMATDALNHPPTFWANLDFLMAAATQAGLYVPIKDGTLFCGKSLQQMVGA